ncbi:MAG: alpha/beta hydrolase [Sandaracinaceae bacterium]|nr:alpha/beta hydrolase [Sandaracinaceae bacterium]
MTGCRGEPAESRPSVDVEVGYATTREATGTTDPHRFFGPRVGELVHGTATVRLPHDPRRGARETGPAVRRSTLVAISPDAAPVTSEEVLVFVHGLDVSFEVAARCAAQLAYDLDYEGRVAFFAWPTSGTYGGDEVRALRSAGALRAWLTELAARARVHVLARSLGARAVTAALRALALEDAPPHFGEVILVTPDVAVDDFIEEIAPAIAPLTDRITVYASANDRSLHYDLEAEALGDTENGVPLDEHFETIDASAVDTSLLGHARGDGRRSVTQDIAALLAGAPRTTRIEQRIGRVTYWTLEGPPMAEE